jgi:hypothetical protein
MRNAPLVDAGRSQESTGQVDSSLAPTTANPEHRCLLCPLCRCHHDCRPEAVSVDG